MEAVFVIITGHEWYSRRIAREASIFYNSECDVGIARIESGELYGGVVLQGYTGPGGSAQLHMAGFKPNWASRDLIWMVFHYAFVQLDCRKVFGQVNETNARALEIDLKLGFKIVAKIDGAFPDGACLVLALAREDCRWLKIKPRKVQPVLET